MNIHTKTPVVILALNFGSERDEKALLAVAGLGERVIKTVEGAYKGQIERSFVLDVGHSGPNFGELNLNIFDAVLRFAEAYKQESVLFLSYSRDAQLIYCHSRDVVNLGQWKSVPKAEAIRGTNWTRDGEQYFVVKEA
jgi:hypothetical protein